MKPRRCRNLCENISFYFVYMDIAQTPTNTLYRVWFARNIFLSELYQFLKINLIKSEN